MTYTYIIAYVYVRTIMINSLCVLCYNYVLLVNIVASTHDVRPTRYLVVFHAGVNSKTFKIAIKDDELVEGTEAFGAKLIIPDHHKSKCLRLGDISVTRVYIIDGMS